MITDELLSDPALLRYIQDFNIRLASRRVVESLRILSPDDAVREYSQQLVRAIDGGSQLVEVNQKLSQLGVISAIWVNDLLPQQRGQVREGIIASPNPSLFIGTVDPLDVLQKRFILFESRMQEIIESRQNK